jgi:hypothetical protein
MTAELTRPVHPVPDGYPATLDLALAIFQADIPPVVKSETAHVTGESKSGKPISYSYTYADLAAVSRIAMPLLGKYGLSFSAKPTWLPPTYDAEGKQLMPQRFALVYKLRHVSGDSDDGEYPLPDPLKVTPQTLCSAVTYARRYCFCSITGIAPQDDDDAAAASAERAPVDDERAGAFYAAEADVQAQENYEHRLEVADTVESLNRIGTEITGDRRLTREQRAALRQIYDARMSALTAESTQTKPPATEEAPPDG